MNAVFFASMLLMLLLAMWFSTAPLWHREKRPSGGFVNVPLLAVIASLLLAIGLYIAIGRPDLGTGAHVAQTSGFTMQTQADAEEKRAASVTELLAGLEQRLVENPDDAKGWLLLAKSYEHIGRPEDAAAAYQKARELGLSEDVLEARRN